MAANMIPLVAVLWEHPGFQGRKRVFCIRPGKAEFSTIQFDNTASSVGIHPGPNYGQYVNGVPVHFPGLPAVTIYVGSQAPTVSLFDDAKSAGRELVLPVGQWPDLQRVVGFNFNDQLSSLHFNTELGEDKPAGVYEGGFYKADVDPASRHAAAIDSIPLTVVLLGPERRVTGGQDTTSAYQVVESSVDLQAEYGDELNDVERVIVKKGPSYTGKEVVRLHRDPNYQGGSITLKPSSTTWDLKLYNFTHRARSLEIGECEC